MGLSVEAAAVRLCFISLLKNPLSTKCLFFGFFFVSLKATFYIHYSETFYLKKLGVPLGSTPLT